ncbi:unnamed protein product, partial [Rodentolepis nana]|uniref:SH3 domain-containing protein n=1 Tax=Rodentolepis nana TaxID=102285 RepID=A0A0R3T6A6_RODNA
EFNSSTDQLSIDDGLDDDNEDVSDSDIEDDDPHPMHATALAAFNGSSARELSFQRGAELFLYRRLNEHWWEGQLASAGGPDAPRYLVPHLYIKPLTVTQSNDGSSGGGAGAVLTNQTLETNGNDINATTASAANGTTSTTDESTSGVDDDGPATATTTSYSEKNNMEVVTLGSPPKKPPRRCSISSVTSGGTESPTHIAPGINESSAESSARIKDEIFSTVTTPESSKGVLHFAVSTNSHRSRSSSPTYDKTEAGLSTFAKVEDVQSSVDVKDSPSLLSEGGTADSPIMTRSMSSSPPPRTDSSSSPLRRSGNRGSWAGVVSSATANAALTAPGVSVCSAITELETLPEGKPADLKPGKKISVDSIESSNGQNNASLHDVDSALAEVMRGLACLEKGRSQGPEANNAAEQRSRELEQKMRLPSAPKPISETLLLKDRPKPPNFNKTTATTEEFQLQLQEDSPTSTTDTFAEQAGGTVRKRVSASFVGGMEAKSKSLLPTSASLSADLGQSEQEIKAPAASTTSSTRWSTRKLAVEKEGGESGVNSGSMMSKSFVVEGRNSGGEKENVTSNSELVTNSTSTQESPVPIKRGSIAARVAAFEASNASTAPPIRPSWVKKI